MSKKQKETKNIDKDITLAKIGNRNAIIVAIIGLIGTLITSYFGYRSNQQEKQNKIDNAALAATLASIRSNDQLPKDLTTGYGVVYPSCKCYADKKILMPFIVRLRWGATSAELAESGADSISYSLSINDETITDMSSYRKAAVFVQDPVLDGDPPDTWWVYWDYLVKDSKNTTIRIEAKLITLDALNNGLSVIPKGSTETTMVTVELFSIMLTE